MINLLGSPRRLCDGISRRQFLSAGDAGIAEGHPGKHLRLCYETHAADMTSYDRYGSVSPLELRR